MTTTFDQDPARLGLRLALRLLPDVLASQANSTVYTGPSTPGGQQLLEHVRGLSDMLIGHLGAALANAAAAELPASLTGHCGNEHDPDEVSERVWNWLQQRIAQLQGHSEHPGEYWAARVIAATMEEDPRRVAEGLPKSAVLAEVGEQFTGAKRAGVDLVTVVESLAFALDVYLLHSVGPDRAQVTLLRALADEPAEEAVREPVPAGCGSGDGCGCGS